MSFPSNKDIERAVHDGLVRKEEEEAGGQPADPRVELDVIEPMTPACPTCGSPDPHQHPKVDESILECTDPIMAVDHGGPGAIVIGHREGDSLVIDHAQTMDPEQPVQVVSSEQLAANVRYVEAAHRGGDYGNTPGSEPETSEIPTTGRHEAPEGFTPEEMRRARETMAKLVNPAARVQKWADVAMWSAPKHQDPQKPVVVITWAPDDPLGLMAMINGMYVGKIYRSPREVSDDERRQAWDDFARSRLSETPAEWFQLSVLFENVTRAFTHQLVRTRTSTYAQESMRFAVKEDAHDSVKLPPSLVGTAPGIPDPAWYPEGEDRREWDYLPDADKMRSIWDTLISHMGEAYEKLVAMGMPAEDARGLLPTNILTRIHDRYDVKTLLNQAGMRLCTQAQFEWRAVFAELVQALRTYLPADHPAAWQYELIAERFRPVCFAANKCTMKAKADRFCSIREQVDEFEERGIKSEHWEQPREEWGLRAIRPEQWLADPAAARVAP
jgi:uncharacterized repeat protein (TIGR04076 family)